MSATSVQFRLKRRNTAGWLGAYPLGPGEPGFETNTGLLKIGNGTSSWSELPYVSNVRSGTAANLSGVVLGLGELGYASDTNVMKIGNNTSTFASLPTLTDINALNSAEGFATSAQSASAAATTTLASVQTALSAAAVSSSAVADTIAAGRGLVADGQYFWVRPVSGSGLTRFTAYRRTNASTQVEVGSVPSATEFDQVRADYTRVGGNLITNSTFSLDTPDTGAYTTPSGYSYNNNNGGGKIVTRPNPAIESRNALEFAFATNASPTYASSLSQLQLKQKIQIPTHLIATGSTLRFIYDIQLNATASTAIASTNSATIYVFDATVTSAVAGGGIITYNFASDIPFPTGTLLSCESMATGSGVTTPGTQLAITVAGDKRSFTVLSGNTGTGSGLARFTTLATVNTKTRDLSTTPSTEWQQVITDTAVPIGYTAIEPIARVNNSTSGAIIWITGLTGVFNRTTLFRYDKNDIEQSTTTATTTATTIATNLVSSVSGTEQIAAPWRIGTNIAPNSLLDADAIGTATPTGYVFLTGGAGTVAAARSIQTCPVTPFNTNRALRMTHSNDGTNRTDGQLGISVSVPTALRDIAFTVRCVYYTNVQDTRISNVMIAYRNGDGGSVEGVVITKSSADGAVNTWFPVVHNITFTAVSGTNSVYLRLVRQQGGVGGVSWGSGFERYSWITGVCFGFNRTNTLYDRNLTSEITTIAQAQASNRQVMNQADQYIDANGMMSRVIPIEQIVAWGDSLTAAGYITNVISSFTSAGVTRTGVNNGIGGETSTQILNRINGYSFLSPDPGVTYNSGAAVTLRARRTQPPRLNDIAQIGGWTTFGLTVAEPSFVNFYTSETLIGTSYTRLSAVSTVTSGSSTLTAVGHPFVTGDIVHFLTSSPASLTAATVTKTNIFRAKHYFVTKLTNDTYTIRELTGDDAVTGAVVFNAAGTVTALGDFTLSWTPSANTASSTITTTTYTNRDSSTIVLWMGANNINQVSTVQSNIASAVEHIKTLGKRVIIMTPIIIIGSGTITGTNAQFPYTTSSTEVVNRNTIGTWILNTYPNNSIDIWSVLRENGNGTAGDNEDIANGGTPRSLRTDGIHLTATGYGIVATEVYNRINTNKW